MRRQLQPALAIFVGLTLLCGIVYPLVITGVAQLVFPGKANGSLVEVDGRTVGSSLIGQNFSDPQYFHPRPSAAGDDGYDGTASAGSNLGPNNPDLVQAVKDNAAAFTKENPGSGLPMDALTASASGLDPDISPANARAQAARVAKARGLQVAQVFALIDDNTAGRALGFMGAPAVHVLALNLALDRLR